MKILEESKEIQEYLKNIRRKLHQIPEISNHEKFTSEFIVNELEKIENINIRKNINGYGIIAELEGNEKGKTIALRADMDALQIKEETGVEFSSKNDGIMHACGHDNHMTILLGTAHLLSKKNFKGKVRFIFQPAEELTPNGGAKGMIKEGALKDVDAIFGLHVWPELELGKFGIKEGALMAASDHFTIKLKGKASHAAKPHEGIDVLVAASQYITSIQNIVSRNTDPMESLVITVGVMRAGTRYNIIPEECFLEGTCRTFSPKIRDLAEKKLKEILTGICTLSGCEGEIKYERGYMPLINEKNMTEYVAKKIEELYGADSLINVSPAMTSEDFSFYLDKIPGAFFWIGTTAKNEKIYPLHSNKYNPNEDVLWRGVALMSKLVLDFN